MSTARRPSAGRRPARPASRPGTRVRTTTRPVRPPVPAAAPGPRPRRLTPRTAVLLLVLVGLGLSFALPVREYLAQRSEIGALQAEQAAARERVAELEAERERLQDPAYVMAEARRRLHYVLPGETAYVVLAPPPAPPEEQTVSSPDAPWYSQLWGTVQSSDRPQR